jgi:hypothetical protein
VLESNPEAWCDDEGRLVKSRWRTRNHVVFSQRRVRISQRGTDFVPLIAPSERDAGRHHQEGANGK